MIGRTIRHYQIEKLIASGGMGEVYLATDARLNRPVALKLLPEAISHDPVAREQLLSEARAASRLNHPNILTIYTEEEVDGRNLIVMEYVAGCTLEEMIAARDLPIGRVIAITLQVTNALSAAHRAGIVHRDIKPANIIVTPEGRAKITDFGLATLCCPVVPEGTAVFAGTVAYASPEQIESTDIDYRTDLWSFGVMLYEMVSGRRPFDDEHATAIAYSIMHDQPRPLVFLHPNAPLELRRIIGRCLVKEPDQRYQSAADLAGDLTVAQTSFESALSGAVQNGYQRRPSIAVLPFSNLSGDPEQEYICDGVAEEITHALTGIRGLHVASRVSAFTYKGKNEDVRDIGQHLDVETVLEGSVRKSDDRLRITAQLINVADGYHLWSEKYDREVKDVLSIQDEIARSIVRALRVILSDDEERAIASMPTSDVQAYDYYLRGLQYFHQGRRKSLEYARQMFSRAIEVDATYARAWAGVANCNALLVHLYGDTSDATTEEADAASRLALGLDPDLADAHAARGFALWLMNRHEESHREFETAIRLDPMQFEARYFYGRACFQAGQFAEALQLFEEACQVRDDHEARFFAAQTYTAMGKNDESHAAYQLALDAVERHVQLNPDNARAVTMGAVALCRLGEPAKGLEWAERAMAIAPEDAGIRYNVACLYVLEGEHEKAIDSLEAAVRAGFAHKDWVENDPDLDSLRDHPRFKALPWRG